MVDLALTWRGNDLSAGRSHVHKQSANQIVVSISLEMVNLLSYTIIASVVMIAGGCLFRYPLGMYFTLPSLLLWASCLLFRGNHQAHFSLRFLCDRDSCSKQINLKLSISFAK